MVFTEIFALIGAGKIPRDNTVQHDEVPQNCLFCKNVMSLLKDSDFLKIRALKAKSRTQAES